MTFFLAYEVSPFQSFPLRYNIWDITAFIVPVPSIREYTLPAFACLTKFIWQQGLASISLSWLLSTKAITIIFRVLQSWLLVASFLCGYMSLESLSKSLNSSFFVFRPLFFYLSNIHGGLHFIIDKSCLVQCFLPVTAKHRGVSLWHQNMYLLRVFCSFLLEFSSFGRSKCISKSVFYHIIFLVVWSWYRNCCLPDLIQ